MERKAFNFYKSYYEVFKMLENHEDKLQFINALLEKQFENKDPGKMLPMATFAYKSQEHNIISQVEGFINKISHPTEGGRQGGIKGGSVQEKEKEEVKDKVKVKEKVQFLTPSIDEVIEKFISLDGTKEMANRYFSSNESRGWIYNGSPIVNWEVSIPAYIKAWKAKDNKQIDEHEKIAQSNRERWKIEQQKFEKLNK